MSELELPDAIDMLKVEQALMRKSFRDFITDAFEVVEFGDEWLRFVKDGQSAPKFVPGWHVDAMAEHLQAVADGQIRRLLINVPPGTMKPVSVDALVTVPGGTKRLADIRIGDEVLTHRGRFRKVLSVFEQGRLPCLELRTIARRSVVAAPDHPFATPEGWVEAGKLKPGDSLLFANAYGGFEPDCLVSSRPVGLHHCQCLSVAQDKSFTANGFAVHNSMLTCVLFPVWWWVRDATKKFIVSSYSESFTKRDMRKAKALINTAWFQARFPHVRTKVDAPDTAMEHHLTAGGDRYGSSTNSGIIGKHANCIIEDDPIKTQDAMSARAREEAWFYHTQVLSTRLLPGDNARIVVMQRLHEDDPSGRILRKLDKEEVCEYEHLCLPMEFESKRRCKTRFFIDPRKEEGELLWPARITASDVAELKTPKALGEMGAAGQLQQRPAPAAGGIIKVAWWRYYVVAPTSFDQMLLSWDLTFKDTGKSWVCGQVWGRKDAEAYLLDQVREKLDFPNALKAIRSMVEKWPDVREKLVEDKANGPAVISSLRNHVPGMLAVPVKASKGERLSLVSPYIESGNVFLPQPTAAAWVQGFIDEVTMFPNGSTDDQCDAASQALLRLFDTLKKKKKLELFQLPQVGTRGNPWEI